MKEKNLSLFPYRLLSTPCRTTANRLPARRDRPARLPIGGIDNSKQVSARELSKIAKSPDKHIGKMLVVYGEVTQIGGSTTVPMFMVERISRIG